MLLRSIGPVLGHLDLAGLYLQDGVGVLHGTRGLGGLVADRVDDGVLQLRAVIRIRMEAGQIGRSMVTIRISVVGTKNILISGLVVILLVGGVLVVGLLRRLGLERDRIRHAILKLIAVRERDCHRLARNGNRVIALVEIDTITVFRCRHRHIIRAEVSINELRVVRQRIGDGHVLVRRLPVDLTDDIGKCLVQLIRAGGAVIRALRLIGEATHLGRIGGHANREQRRIATPVSLGNSGAEIRPISITAARTMNPGRKTPAIIVIIGRTAPPISAGPHGTRAERRVAV